MANPSFKGRVKNAHVAPTKAKKFMVTGEIKPFEGNLMDVKFTTKIKVGLGDVVEARRLDGNSAEILKVIRKAK